MKRIFTKLVIVVSILGFVNQPFFVPRTHAQFIDPMNFTKEYGLDAFAKLFLQRFLNKIVDSTLSWAAGGFDGEPSFISNWDDFLKDTEKDAIEIGLDYALYKGQARLGDLSKDLQNKRAICEAEVYSKLKRQYTRGATNTGGSFGVSLNLGDTPSAPSNLGSQGGYQNGVYQGNSAISGSNLDFGGTSTENLISSYRIPEDVLASEIKKECGSEIKGKSAHALAQAARDNFMRYNSGGGLDARYAAITIAKYGAKELNSDPLKESIDEERPLNKLLGRGGRMDYKSDFSKGGWLAYIAQSGDNPIVNHSKIINKVSEKMKEKVNKKLDEVKTPNKHLDKVKCTKGTDENGNCKTGGLKAKGTEKEGKAEVVTDKKTIGAKTDDAATSGEKESRLADEFTEVLVSAAQRLINGLITIGAQKLISDISNGNSKGNAFYDQLKDFATTQDDYDVLGIDADANLSNNAQNNNNNNLNSGASTGGESNIYNVMAGDDASIQYIGGPEDVDSENYSLTSGPETIIDLHKVLGKSLILSKAYLDELVKDRVILRHSIDYARVLDYCLPGPDYGWEKRYKDRVRRIKNDSYNPDDDPDEVQRDCDKDFKPLVEQWNEAINITREMNSDSFLNIPGAPQLRSTVQSLLEGDVLKSFDGISSDLSEKRRVYISLLTVRESILERMEKIRKQLGISVQMPLFEDQIQEEQVKPQLEEKLSRLQEESSREYQAQLPSESQQDINQQAPDINVDSVDDANHISEKIKNDLNTEIKKDVNIKVKSFTPKKVPIKEQIEKFNKIDDLNNENKKLVKLPNLSNYNFSEVKWKISDKDLLSILKLPASLVDKNAKPGELLVENLGLYIFKKKPTSQKTNSNTVGAVTKKEVVTETPEDLVANNKKKAAELALDLSWALWRKFAPRGEKARARYQYHLLNINGKIITERDYLNAQLNTKNLSAIAGKAVSYARDCSVFVPLALNKESDRELDRALEAEYQKQQNGEKSIFSTDLFTSPAHRKTSILKFTKTQELDNYYNSLYPDAIEWGKAHSVREILGKDHTLKTLRRVSLGDAAFDSEAFKYASTLPSSLVHGLFSRRSTFIPRIREKGNTGKILYCNGELPRRGSLLWLPKWPGPDCWNGKPHFICVPPPFPGDGQYWYYAPKKVYSAAISQITNSSF